MLGLPDGVTACLFDLDGVLTQTAKVHAAAWKEMFDGFLRDRAARTGERFVPFDAVADYDEYVDGKPRYDGVTSFLQSRGISLPQGTPDDPPGAETIDGLGNRKNEIVLNLIHDDGVQPYEGSVRYVKAAREAGLRRVVVSSSTNCRDVLVAAGIPTTVRLTRGRDIAAACGQLAAGGLNARTTRDARPPRGRAASATVADGPASRARGARPAAGDGRRR